jgi:hypothetical protein
MKYTYKSLGKSYAKIVVLQRKKPSSLFNGHDSRTKQKLYRVFLNYDNALFYGKKINVLSDYG